MYNNGRASYVLNQASVGLLASHLDDDDCQPHRITPWEDLLVRQKTLCSESPMRERNAQQEREKEM